MDQLGDTIVLNSGAMKRLQSRNGERKLGPFWMGDIFMCDLCKNNSGGKIRYCSDIIT